MDAVKALAIGWKDKAIAQAKPKAKSAGILGGSFGAAAYLAVKAFWLLLLAGSAAFEPCTAASWARGPRPRSAW